MATASRVTAPSAVDGRHRRPGHPAEEHDLTPLVRALQQAAAGDVTVRLRPGTVPDDVAEAFNELVGANARMAKEVDRIAKVVGRDGLITERAALPGAGGAWTRSVESINTLIDDLVRPTTEFARVIDAVAKGDLSQRMALRIEGRQVKGEFLRIRSTVNEMVDRLSSFADEVTRVAREVGTEGKLGGQAKVKGVSGVWKDLTDNVNTLAGNLTSQVRNIAEVTTAVANGDLSRKVTVDVRGEVLQLKDTVNTMVDQLRSFADEVTRVAREVGTEGKLGGQAHVGGVSGVWKDLTDNVNTLAGNLTTQVRNIAQVTTAVAKGDLSQKITVDARGEVLQLKDTVNTMVDQLRSFADEVTRVAREVGTEGKLGGQANVEGVSGVWKDLTDNVNTLAGNLTDQVRNIAEVTTAVANGDLSQKITVDVRGEVLQLKDTVNTMVDQLRSFAAEVTRVAREVGMEGRLGGQANVEGVSGTWRDLTDNVNTLAGNLTDQVRNIAHVATAVAKGDLSQKITVDAKGEILALKSTINTMVDQLSSFADEVTRVAREVGTDGKLGGQANVEGVSGTWRDLTDSVNFMASNLTSQVRNIAEVTTAVATGDLSQKITVDVKGEILELKDTINTMVDQLSSFADEVTRVAREVGTEGKLGGQANVEGVSGVWKDLTDNVNFMASSLTTQVRAIADVSMAVTQGDLTQSITVETQGEVAELKDRINQMIVNLRETTARNAEQAWLSSNLARFSGSMQGQRDLKVVSNLIMSELPPLVGAHHGAFFLIESYDTGEPVLTLAASYGLTKRRGLRTRIEPGEGLVGQAVVEKKPILVENAPPSYLRISSSLGEAPPVAVIVLPVLFEDRVMGVIELGSLSRFSDVHLAFFEQLAETVGIVINAIVANMRTEELLQQSQSLTQELQKQQKELQQTNDELAEKNERIEVKNTELDMARLAIEEKAEQLALSSQYKSEFLANMSHELRTPLNSLLILAKLLSDNAERNLSDKQVEFARTIFAAGNDLLSLIDDILDLSKVEAGKMTVVPSEVGVAHIVDYVDRSFRPLIEEKGLAFVITTAPDVPATITTDEQRLQQVLRNLLSNAGKFTETGGVYLDIDAATTEGGEPGVAFAVRDTGIGIAQERLALIFEPFQQADGTTSRRFGGTGLGLSISREIAKLLSGTVEVASSVGTGSTFRLVVPCTLDVPGVSTGIDVDDVLTSDAVARSDAALLDRVGIDDDRDDLAAGDRVLLVVEDDPQLAQTIVHVARGEGFKCVVALRGDTGVALAHQLDPDAILLDVRLPVIDGSRVIDHLKRHPRTRAIPVHVVSGVDASSEALRALAASFSEKPISDETLRDLLTTIGDAPERLARPRGRAYAPQAAEVSFSGRRALVVDDDVRNVFALASVLEAHGMEVTYAENGTEAIRLLERNSADIVLMDVMMPEMDGYETMRAIRSMPDLSALPIIAVTAKAMKGDRERAIASGASDYVKKPVDADQLLSLLDVWLFEPEGGRSEATANAVV